MQVAEPEHQADQAERAEQQCRQRPLAQGGVGGWQLPAGRRHPFRLRPAPPRRLVSGHQNLLCPLRRASSSRAVGLRRDLRLVVLVSGEGTNLQALIDACRDQAYGAQVVAVGADRDGISALARAERAGLPSFVLRLADYPAREDWDARWPGPAPPTSPTWSSWPGS